MKKNAPLLLISLFALSFSGCDSQKSESTEGPGYYQEAHRPQIHFSPEEKWMNDPNGMVYYEGEYHLFYQYYPDSTVWGPMHWGHAISKDLVYWEHLPIALYPDELGLIFSGSAVIDWNNTSGLQQGEHPPMVAIFTQHLMAGEKADRDDFQVQSIAYSNDKGRSWTMYEGNPVIPNPGIRDFRDPKVFWHEDSQKWVMIFAAGDRVKLYNSPDLKSWEFLSDFGENAGGHGGVWECPDLFKMKVEGSEEEQWVMLVSINPGGPNGGSATQYFVGDFDGKTFENIYSPETIKWLDYGRDNYAGVTWSDVPESDGRRLFIGWMSNWDYAQVVPTEKWRSAMTIPRSLHLVKNEDDYLVASRPVAELDKLAGRTIPFKGGIIDASSLFYLDRDDQGNLNWPLRIELTVDLVKSTSTHFGLHLENPAGDVYTLGLNGTQLYSNRTNAGKTDFEDRFAKKEHSFDIADQLGNETVKMEVFIDRSSIEIFVDDGVAVMTDLVFPNGDFDQVYLFSEDGDLKIEGFKSTELKGIWSK